MSVPATDPRYLEMFPAWLGSLGTDAAALGHVVAGDAPEPVRRYVVSGLNYLFKSLDLIPDGIDDLGFLDDAFVLRVAASLALADQPRHSLRADDSTPAETVPATEVLNRLAHEAAAVQEFLGEDYVRLESYVKNLRKGAARGRTVDDIMTDATLRTTFAGEVQAWSQSFEAPSFTRDPKTLIKLRAFLSAKLP